MKKIYAVIDTNIIISALIKWQSNPGKIIELVSQGKVVPVVNKKIIEEYEEVCSRKKFGFDKPLVKKFISQIENYAVTYEPAQCEEDFFHESDRVFYEVTLSAIVAVRDGEETDAFLVSGNLRHFPKKPFVVSPAEFVAIAEENNS